MTEPNDQPVAVPGDESPPEATPWEQAPSAADADSSALDPVAEGELDGDVDPALAPASAPVARADPRPRPDIRPVAAVLGGIAAAVLGGAVVLGGLAATGNLRADASTATPSAAATTTAEATAEPSPTAALFISGSRLGRPDAPVIVEVWADYQCSYCGLEAKAFGASVIREFVLAGRAQVILRDFAFLGPESTDAAVAARCAGRQDPSGSWRYHDLLFVQQQGANQGAFSRQNLVALARVAGLDEAVLTACLDDTSVAQEVAAETKVGRDLGIESTPTTRITGPGGTRTLKGFSSDWTVIASAIVAVESAAASPAPGASSEPGTSPAGEPDPGTSPEPAVTPVP